MKRNVVRCIPNVNSVFVNVPKLFALGKIFEKLPF